LLAGRVANDAATSAAKTPAASVAMCPASASNANEPARTPPTTCTAITDTVMPRTAISRRRCPPVAVANIAP